MIDDDDDDDDGDGDDDDDADDDADDDDGDDDDDDADADDDDDNMYGFYCVLAMYIGSRSSEGILGGLLQANTCTKEHIL